MSGTDGVLVAVDGSAQDGAVVDWATDEAAALGMGLTVVQLWEGPAELSRTPAQVGPGDRRDEQAVLDAAVGRVAERAAGVPVRTSRVVGDPLPGLLELASQSDRIVLGDSRTGRWHWSLAGQVASRTRRSAVIVRGRVDASGPVVAGLSGLAGDNAALGEAFRYAGRRGLPLRVLRPYRSAYLNPIGPVPPYSPGADAREAVEAAIAPWARSYPDVLVECAALPGPAAYRLLEVSGGSGLLVVGCAGSGVPLRGSLIRALSRRSRCPVMVARS